MRRSLYAEWTKLRTVVSTPWLVLAAVGLTVLAGALASWSVDTSLCASPTTCDEDTTKLSLFGVQIGQLAVVVLGTLAVTTEYDTKMVRSTLTANPRRTEVLAAKAAVLTAVVLGAGLLGVLGSLVAARTILPANGFTAAKGYPPLSLADEPTLRAYAGSVGYLGLVALLSLGLGTIIRHTAGALSTVLAMLYVLPVVAQFLTDANVRRLILKLSPMTAGLAIQATRRLDSLPIGPWAGLGVLAAYAGGALLVGGVLFAIRDG